MSYSLIAFIAGFLTVLAPCSLFLLPTIIVGSTSEENPSRPWVITLSLGISVFLFSLIIKGTSLAFVVPDQFWAWVSGVILILFGLSLFFPDPWKNLSSKLSFNKSQTWLNKSSKKKGTWGAVLMGASLGPVFTTCSPTFAVLIAVILPVSFLQGMFNIGIFVVGMMIPFLLIGMGGQKMVGKFRFMANPQGWFRRSLGIILAIIGIIIIGGFQKSIESTLIERGYFGSLSIEQQLLEKRRQEEQGQVQQNDQTQEQGQEKAQGQVKEQGQEQEQGHDQSKARNPKENLEIDRSIQQKFKAFKTDLSQSSIPFDRILSGGPGKDGIPALNNPNFTTINDASLQDEDLGIFLSINQDQRFYPLNILVWHEIVNDTVGGKKVAVTFCPLCGSAIVFDSSVNGELLDFGVSGFLFESNLLMYDHQTESFWSQTRGEGVVGEHTGTKLERIEMQRIPWSELKEKYPQSKVLSTDTGYNRNYSIAPYGDYDESEDLYFPVSIQDQRFHTKEMMLVVPVNETWVAFPWKALREKGTATLTVDNKELRVIMSGSETQINYEGNSLPSYFEMWFSFATHHQDDSLIWIPEKHNP